jgi:hypothetical protein
LSDPPPPDEQTGTGASRSGAQVPTQPEQAADYDDDEIDEQATLTGATTSSHPAAADDVTINRSGSGGTGGPGDDTDER